MKCAGVCFFDHDPGESAIEAPPIWSPHWSPTTLMLVPAKEDRSHLRPIRLDRAVHIAERPDGKGIVIDDDRVRHYLWATDPQALSRPAVMLPIDTAAHLRHVAAERFLRHATGRSVPALPPPLALTPQKIGHLIDELHALDFYKLGVPPREIAGILLDPDALHLRAIEWKGSAIRSRVMRMIRTGIRLMEGGYRALLLGNVDEIDTPTSWASDPSV